MADEEKRKSIIKYIQILVVLAAVVILYPYYSKYIPSNLNFLNRFITTDVTAVYDIKAVTYSPIDFGFTTALSYDETNTAKSNFADFEKSTLGALFNDKMHMTMCVTDMSGKIVERRRDYNNKPLKVDYAAVIGTKDGTYVEDFYLSDGQYNIIAVVSKSTILDSTMCTAPEGGAKVTGTTSKKLINVVVANHKVS